MELPDTVTGAVTVTSATWGVGVSAAATPVPAEDVSLVDLDTGHWPMISRPDLLARVLDDTARR